MNRHCTCRKCGKAYEAPIQSRHRIICGDSTVAADVERLMDGQRAALAFTSPPYNAGDNSLGGNKNRVDSKYVGVSDDKPLADYLRLLVDFTALALTHCQTVAVNLQSLAGNKTAVLDWIHRFKDHFVDRMIWFKGQGQPAMAANVMNSRFEDIWILSPEQNPSRAIPTGEFHSTVSNVYEGRGASGENVAPEIHAASMPVHLALHVLSSLDGTNGVVYEPFCGTGTTIIAAEQLGRRCLAVELVPQYVDVAVRRWQEFTGKAAVLERTGEALSMSKCESPVSVGGAL
jgi:DNA modification methylase